MKLIYILFGFILILTTFVRPISVSAHVLETNNTVGAVIHIDPNDDPIAGQVSTFFFDFKDTEGEFNVENCECVASIWENNQELFSKISLLSIPDSTANNASFEYSFPKKGVYEIKVSGKPKTDQTFNQFELKYTVRVEKEAPPSPSLGSNTPIQEKSPAKSNPLVVLGSVMSVVFISILFISFQRRKQKGTHV